MDNSAKNVILTDDMLNDDVLREKWLKQMDELETAYNKNAKARGIDTNAPISSYEKMYDMYISGFQELSYLIYGKDEVEECIPLYEKLKFSQR